MYSSQPGSPCHPQVPGPSQMSTTRRQCTYYSNTPKTRIKSTVPHNQTRSIHLTNTSSSTYRNVHFSLASNYRFTSNSPDALWRWIAMSWNLFRWIFSGRLSSNLRLLTRESNWFFSEIMDDHSCRLYVYNSVCTYSHQFISCIKCKYCCDSL